MASTTPFSRLLLNSPHLPTKHFIPPLVYGTAWKKDRTTDLVHTALENGFSAIDTACQPKHYREDLVGEGVRRYLQSHPNTNRTDLYIQTKFTSMHGQDAAAGIPYNPSSPLTEQVQDSLQTSLRNFTISPDTPPYLDSVVLHSPMPSMAETLQVWEVLEHYVSQSKILHLGISNCNLFTLMDLYERATVKPSIVQNRFYGATKYDIGLRKFCRDRGIVYQSFWTLSANPNLLRCKAVLELMGRVEGLQKEGALYALVTGLGGTTVLDGTTSERHMREDWRALDTVRTWAEGNQMEWEGILGSFRKAIGEIR